MASAGITCPCAVHDMAHHPFRFGVQASNAPTCAVWVSLARRTEGHDYSVLTMPDNFGDQLAPVPAMTSDYQRLGIPYDTPGVRTDRFLEG